MISMSFHRIQPTQQIHLNGLCFKWSALQSHKWCFSAGLAGSVQTGCGYGNHKERERLLLVVHNAGLGKAAVTPGRKTASPSQNSEMQHH